MTTAPQPTCILPGCPNPTSEQGRPCDECLTDCGEFLRPSDGPAMTAEQQATRDEEISRRYVLQQDCAARGVARADLRRPLTTRTPGEPERKANQRCWMCEERRTCTKQEHGWECDTCRSIE